MAARFVNIDHDTPLLLPPDLREWVPAGHLVHFIMDAVGELDWSGAPVNERGTGDAQYPPGMMLGLLIYSYATGVFSSRQIENTTYESVPVRLLCADTHPDHDTICAFRRQNQALLRSSFCQVLEMAARCQVLKVGGITVAIDGTKVLANASKHAAVSYQRAGEQMGELDLEIEQLLRKAEQADATPLEDGLSIPEEVQRRQERKALLAKARAEMEARAAARAQAERGEYEAKVVAREEKRRQGRKPGGKEPQPPSETPGPKDQYNFTDPESRIMKAGSGGHFEQSYNAQAAVEVDSRLIVGQRVAHAPNDKEQLLPSFAAVVAAAGPIKEVLVDSGFVSEEAVTKLEQNAPGHARAVVVLAAIQREAHGRTVAQLEKKPDPPAPAENAPFLERMAHRVATRQGRARYKLRQQTVEPVFGIIKEALGFRRFSLRGLQKVALEWTLVTLAYNCKRLFHVGAKLAAA
jgi:transposase